MSKTKKKRDKKYFKKYSTTLMTGAFLAPLGVNVINTTPYINTEKKVIKKKNKMSKSVKNIANAKPKTPSTRRT